jgi:F-type H+-transporting ATPase subunit c
LEQAGIKKDASDDVRREEPQPYRREANDEEETLMNTVAIIAVAAVITLPAVASALSQGWATTSAMSGVSRQPETAGDVRTTLLIALAFMEALTLFAFVIAILLWTKI